MNTEWTAWTNFGRPGEASRFTALALGKHHDGRLALFGGDDRGELWHRAEGGGGSWSEWGRIGDDSAHVNFHSLAVGVHQDSRLAVFTLSPPPTSIHLTHTTTRRPPPSAYSPRVFQSL
jgi:hypothetical protein